jgi:hypothetical protein
VVKLAKGVCEELRTRDGMRYGHCNNIEKKLRTRREKDGLEANQPASEAGQRSKREGSCDVLAVPESQLRREDPGKPKATF